MTETSQTSPFFSEPFKCGICRTSFPTFRELLEHAEDPASHHPDTAESGESYDVEMTVPCFKCGVNAVGATWIATGTQNGIPLKVQLVSVCGSCYDLLKEKVRTRSRLSDDRVSVQA